MENKTALDKFLELHKEIESILEELQEAQDDYYDTNPKEVNWGHVGDLGSLKETLQQALNKVKGTG